MENKVKVDVKVIHYIDGQNIQGINDIEHLWDLEPLYIDKKLLNGEILSLSAINDYCSAIDGYCRKLAKKTTPYNTYYEDYLLQFYYNGDLISSAILSNYAYLFGQNTSSEE